MARFNPLRANLNPFQNPRRDQNSLGSTNDFPELANIVTADPLIHGYVYILNRNKSALTAAGTVWEKSICALYQGGQFVSFKDYASKKISKWFDLMTLSSPYMITENNEFNDYDWKMNVYCFQWQWGDGDKDRWILATDKDISRSDWVSKIMTLLRLKKGHINMLVSANYVTSFNVQTLTGQTPNYLTPKKKNRVVSLIINADEEGYPDVPYEEVEEEDANKVIEQCAAGKLDELDLSGLKLHGWYKMQGGPVYDRVPKVSILDLSLNMLTDIPDDFYRLKEIEELIVNGCRIAQYPKRCYEFHFLKELSLNGNLIPAIPQEIGYITGLIKLKMRSNKLTSIDPAIGCLRSLKELNLGGNRQLGSTPAGIPASIGELRALQVLDLSMCGIERVPPEICFCEKLLELNLSSNQIQALPSDLGRMSCLMLLNLSENQITELPFSMGFCKLLGNDSQESFSIDLSGNALKKEYIHADSKALIKYLTKRMELAPPKFGPPPKLPDRYAALPALKGVKSTVARQVAKENREKKRSVRMYVHFSSH